MCKIVNFNIGGRIICAADIKKSYIKNIAEKASGCDLIEKVVLFGSATNENCTEDSDIDIAVFGGQSEARVLRSKSYKNFVRELFKYDYSQDYDILYFDSSKDYNTLILNDISNGQILYEKSKSSVLLFPPTVPLFLHQFLPPVMQPQFPER